MAWKLWVVIALVVTGLVVLAVARMRHARKVFDDITHVDRPAEDTQPDLSADDLTRARARQTRPDPDGHRKHG